jgi:1,4-alpha-glucan branching enzyme
MEAHRHLSLRSCFMILAASAAIGIVQGCASSGVRTAGEPIDGYEIVEGGAIFKYYDPDVSKVCLAGDFNNWSPVSDPMLDKNKDGHWMLFYPLKPGRYEYKFVIDGKYWIVDPRNPQTVSDGFEGGNSVIVVPGAQ